MYSRLFMFLATRLSFVLMAAGVPFIALADCGDYPLTPDQAAYLDTRGDLEVPEGTTPFVQRCDIDGNNIIDNRDLFAIREHLKQPAAHPDDPMDWDGDGLIHGRDVGGCAKSCTDGCAVKNDSAEEEGFQEAAAMNQDDLPGESGACYEVADLDSDGNDDFIGIFEYGGSETRGNNWTLQIVILRSDENGDVVATEFQYSGQKIGQDLQQHLGLQQPGTIDLDPGQVVLTEPGVVSYQGGEPKVVYYFDSTTSSIAQAFYGIDD